MHVEDARVLGRDLAGELLLEVEELRARVAEGLVKAVELALDGLARDALERGVVEVVVLAVDRTERETGGDRRTAQDEASGGAFGVILDGHLAAQSVTHGSEIVRNGGFR